MIISPASPITPTVARVWPGDKSVLCKFKESHDKFRAVVKRAGFSWSENAMAWRRRIDPALNGEPSDRAAELAAELVAAGFLVDVDEGIARAVQSASWQPEQKRWVLAIDGKFHLRWRGADENLYLRAKGD